MKKVKIMLMSLPLFAVVGGALAFNAKFGIKFCTATIDNGCVKACPDLTISTTTTQGTTIWCTALPTTSTKDAGGNVVPEFSTCTTFDEIQEKSVTVGCVASTTLIID